MAFLTLNGITIPVNKCEEVHQELGERARMFSGRYNVARRAIKRRWRFATPPVYGSQAETIKGLVQGLGNCWRFDDGTLYDAKGYTLDPSGAVYITIADMTTAAGNVVSEEVISDVVRYGRRWKIDDLEPTRYSIAATNNTTNRLASLERKIQSGSAASFAADDGATVSVVDTKSWAGGGYALKVVTSGTVNSVKGGAHVASGIGVSAGQYANGTVYLLSEEASAADRTLEVYLYDATNTATSTIATVTLEQNKWTRVHIPGFLLPSGSSNCQLFVREATADSNITFYMDGLQIIRSNTDTGSGAWTDGLPTGGDSIIQPDNLNFLDGNGDYTFLVWASNPSIIAGTSERYVFDFVAKSSIGALGSVPRVRLRRNPADGDMYFGVTNSDGTEVEASGTVDFNNGGSVHLGQMILLAGVVRLKPNTGESNVELYAAGSLIDSANGTIPDLTLLGGENGDGGVAVNENGTDRWLGAIDDFTVLPYAMDAASISALATRGRFSSLPECIAEGDFCPDLLVRVNGELGSCSTRPTTKAGTWENDAEIIGFTLQEV